MREENIIYIRKSKYREAWEAFGKAMDTGFFVSCLTREETVKHAGRTLWAINEFGPDEYGAAMAGLDDKDYPEIEYPVIEETRSNP